MVLIISKEGDFATANVAKKLSQMGQEFLIIDATPGLFKFVKISPSEILFKKQSTGRVYNLLEFSACWWRRTGLGIHQLTSDIPDRLQIDNYDLTRWIKGAGNYLTNEYHDLREYIFDTIYDVCPINIGNPKRMDLNRLVMLREAQKIGLMTPDFFIVTNYNQIEALDFSGERFVVKAINNGIYDFHAPDAFYSYTESHEKSEFRGKDTPLFPSLVMPCINKSFEIRSFYLDGKFYSMAIFSQRNEKTIVDFRKYDFITPNKREPFQLPSEIELKIDYLFKKLDLNCGSVDLIVDTNGDYVFLEINPVGQFGMTSNPCNYNLELIVAKYLANGPGYKNIERRTNT